LRLGCQGEEEVIDLGDRGAELADVDRLTM
jgi:hypothetical protein